MAGVKPTQLRKDLTYLGQFGTRGLGYAVAELSRTISGELGTTSLQPVVLIGAGHLGLALLSYRGFEKEGFEIVGAFDSDPNRRREKEVAQPLLPMDELVEFVNGTGDARSHLHDPLTADNDRRTRAVVQLIMGMAEFQLC